MNISPRAVFLYVPAMLGCICTFVSVLQVYYFQVNDWDFSYFLHIPWSIAQGTGLVAPFALAFELPFYAHHATPLIAVLAPLFALFPSPYFLAILHGLAISACFFLVPVLVREIAHSLGKTNYLGVACFLVLLLFCYKPFMAAWRYETHMTTLVIPCVFGALILLHRGKMWGVGLCCLALLLAQERAAVTVAGIGMYAFLVLRMYRLGIILCCFASVYFFTVIKVYFPYVRSALGSPVGYAFSGAIQPLHEVPLKLMYLVKLCLFTLGLPFAGKKAFLTALCALPVLGVNIISSRSSMYAFSHHHQDLLTAFMLASAAYGIFYMLDYVGECKCLSNTLMRKKLLSVVACLCLVVSFVATRFQHPAGLISGLLQNPRLTDIGQLNADIEPILALEKTIPIYSQSSIGPRIALRHNRFTLTSDILHSAFSKSVIVISPLLGTYMLGEYVQAEQSLRSNPSLTLVAESPRLLIFVATDMDDTIVQSLRATSLKIGTVPAS